MPGLEPVAEPSLLRARRRELIERAARQLHGPIVADAEAPTIGSQLPVPGWCSVSSRSPSGLRLCVLPVGTLIPPMIAKLGLAPSVTRYFASRLRSPIPATLPSCSTLVETPPPEWLCSPSRRMVAPDVGQLGRNRQVVRNAIGEAGRCIEIVVGVVRVDVPRSERFELGVAALFGPV